MTVASKKSSPTIPPVVSKGAALVLGLIFLAAGVAKAVDLNEAVRQAGAYNIVTDRTVLLFLVWGMVLAECALGAALVLRYRIRIALVGLALMLAVFFGALGWAWTMGLTEDCGCFGQWVSRSPGQALLEDIFLVVLLGLAWLRPESGKSRVKPAAVVLVCLATLALPFAFGFSLDSVLLPGVEGPPVEPLTVLDGQAVDWSASPYLVELMSTDCLHCQESVMDVNILAATPGIPPIKALCFDSPEDIAAFRETYLPEYPLLRIAEKDYWRLVANGSSPRFLLVREGHVVRAWEVAPPLAGEILSILEPSP
ncbi:MAG: hypothetical protein JEZ02_04005 [Desulfatibacillum sp.]|nr:hypothetical protein [Desulfatibacillum sp.]